MSEWERPAAGGLKESEVIEYQAVSTLAVVGLVVGFISAGATIWPLFWIVPPLGILLNLVAMARIAADPAALTGRKLALVGLVLSVFFAALVPTDRLASRRLLRREAQQFAAQWFDALRGDRPVEAFQLSVDPRYRRPLEHLRQQIRRAGSEDREGLEEYLDQEDVRCLLALGEKAQVKHYATENVSKSKEGEIVVDVYAVTFEDNGEKKTFFLRLGLQRFRLPNQEAADWHVASSSGGYKPIALGGKG